MGLIDTTFADYPKKILGDWGRDITYVKTVTPRVYDPTTGSVSGADTTVTVKAFISNVSSQESEGLYQTTDLKVIFGTDELGTYYPTQADRIQYTQAGVTREAKILQVKTVGGDDPVMHTIIARPQ